MFFMTLIIMVPKKVSKKSEIYISYIFSHLPSRYHSYHFETCNVMEIKCSEER